MTIVKFSVFVVVCSLAAALGAQSTLAGKWTGDEKSARGAVPVVLQLEVKNAEATGAVTLGQNPSQAIVDGKVNGNSLTFRTVTILNGKEISFMWQGNAKDDELTLVRTLGEGGRKFPEITMRRAK